MKTFCVCAPSPYIEELRPQTEKEAQLFVDNCVSSGELKRVWTRFVVSGGRTKYSNWLKRHWFFKNFTSVQLNDIMSLTFSQI